MPVRLFRRSVAWACACTALFLLAWPLAAAAQTGNQGTQGPTAQAAVPDGPSHDYMLSRPRGAISARGLWHMAGAGSDIFDFVTDELTLEKSAFNAPGIAFEVDFSLSTKLDVVAGIDNTYASQDSEYRDYVDNDEQPIEQKTSLRQFGIYGSVKYALAPRGRPISRYAWVPRTVTPYVGAGGGVIKYDFKQSGDFIDFADMSVFGDTFRSEGWTPSAHAFGGLDIRAFRSLYVTAEARYTWASADLGPDFEGFEPIDLSGFNVGAGIRLVF